MDGPGRPTLYKADFAEQAYELSQAGATNQVLADFFDVSSRTLDNWLSRRPEFARSVKRGRELADARVACGLYSRAVGYTHRTTRTVLHRGEPVSVPHAQYFPPDVRACIFWLRNRRPQQWLEGRQRPPEEEDDCRGDCEEAAEPRIAA